jgi:ATP-dependent DNA helicase RecG
MKEKRYAFLTDSSAATQRGGSKVRRPCAQSLVGFRSGLGHWAVDLRRDRPGRYVERNHLARVHSLDLNGEVARLSEMKNQVNAGRRDGYVLPKGGAGMRHVQLVQDEGLARFGPGSGSRGLDSQRVLALLDREAYFEATGAVAPQSPDQVVEAFATDRLVTVGDEGWDLTPMGVLLFARDLSLFDGLREKRVRVVEFRGTDRAEPVADRAIEHGYVRALQAAMTHVERAVSLMVKRSKRGSASSGPLAIAAREVIVNAVIHQDFSLRGPGPIIELFADRIEVTNLGVPVIAPHRWLDSPPRSRNDALAMFARRIGLCEERGAGIDRAVGALESERLPAPEFRANDDRVTVILRGPRPFADLTQQERCEAVYLHVCLCHVNHEAASAMTLCRRFGLRSSLTASELIAAAVAAGLVRELPPEPGLQISALVPF